MNEVSQDYDNLVDGAETDIEVTVLAVAEAIDGVPVVLAKLDETQVELWPATTKARRAARAVARGDQVSAHVSKCPHVISDRSYGGLRKAPQARIRFARLLEVRAA